jgi:hypothetical protein
MVCRWTSVRYGSMLCPRTRQFEASYPTNCYCTTTTAIASEKKTHKAQIWLLYHALIHAPWLYLFLSVLKLSRRLHKITRLHTERPTIHFMVTCRLRGWYYCTRHITGATDTLKHMYNNTHYPSSTLQSFINAVSVHKPHKLRMHFLSSYAFFWVPKRWHLNYRRRGINQKKAYVIQHTAKVWNQEFLICFYHNMLSNLLNFVYKALAHIPVTRFMLL